jgi:hypothetical protein
MSYLDLSIELSLLPATVPHDRERKKADAVVEHTEG